MVQPLDGMVINPYSLPGGAYSGFNGGMSVVHEAGCEALLMLRISEGRRRRPEHGCTGA